MAIEDIGSKHEYSIDIRLEEDEGGWNAVRCISTSKREPRAIPFKEGGGLEDALVSLQLPTLRLPCSFPFSLYASLQKIAPYPSLELGSNDSFALEVSTGRVYTCTPAAARDLGRIAGHLQD